MVEKLGKHTPIRQAIHGVECMQVCGLQSFQEEHNQYLPEMRNVLHPKVEQLSDRLGLHVRKAILVPSEGLDLALQAGV